MNLFNFSLKTVKSQPGKSVKLNVFSTDDMQIGELKVVLLSNDTRKFEGYVKYIPYENAEGRRISKLKFANMEDYEETMEKMEKSIEDNSKNPLQALAAKTMLSKWIVDGEIDFSDIFFIRNEFAIKVLGDDWLGVTLFNNENYLEELKAIFETELQFIKAEKKRKAIEEYGELGIILQALMD